MGRIDHSAAGAILATDKNKWIGRILGYLIAGHHTGLPDWHKEPGTKGDPLSERLSNPEHLMNALKGNPPENILNTALPSSLPCKSQAGGTELVHLWIRMLYSCLVDADFLDTERFMNPEKSELRPNEVDLVMLRERLDVYMAAKENGALDTPVNRARKEILRECRDKGRSLEPGLFSLTVPTGGGKTLASLTFALEHAIRHGKKRIIVAIPYTSIIEQTAAVYREVFGDDNVLEHHSNLDPATETAESRLATENWDAPIIVTTNVQLFESLFAARSSACRKLHNIVNSVVVLDEAQMLPTDFLQPIVSVIKSLTVHFRASIVLCTATQPVLSGKIGTGRDILKGFAEGSVRELMPDPEKLFSVFQRVRVRMLGQAGERYEWTEIARQLQEHEQVLCIVNTRKDCRELHAQMPVGTVHLSALMCPEHRSKVISEVKSKLMTGELVRVVSTQLLEAGVDIDFPTVYRSFSGLDSIAQAAGRCNREGRLECGDVVVFNPPKPSPSGRLMKAENAAQELFRTDPELASSLMPEAFSRYFIRYFSGLNGFDTKQIMDLLAGNDALKYQIQFRTAAKRFKLIDDTLQHGIIVRYRDGKANIVALIDQLRFGGPNRKLMRLLQRYAVNVYDPDLKQLRGKGLIEEVNGVWVQTADSLYDPVFGLNIDATLNFVY
ncbi:MAG: CRISPR-associated helicase Cas3' [Chlorobium limicola]|jgi:CRISPR-associated endonuclease/helicase Cas3|nr:CRISPR-associated helicase Cas3' [Chlorobium limicola]